MLPLLAQRQFQIQADLLAGRYIRWQCGERAAASRSNRDATKVPICVLHVSVIFYLKVCFADNVVLSFSFWANRNSQVDVKSEWVIVTEICWWQWILCWIFNEVRAKSFDRHDPWGNGSAEGFGKERSKWDILPGLDVTSWSSFRFDIRFLKTHHSSRS